MVGNKLAVLALVTGADRWEHMCIRVDTLKDGKLVINFLVLCEFSLFI
jgi:hypothetical protein